MKKRLALVLALVLALSMVFASSAFAKPECEHAKAKPWQVYKAELHPLNDSGVHGTAWVFRRGGTIKVKIVAEGYEPGVPHPQHIHGFIDPNMNAVCPPMSAAGEDGILTLAEGLPYYGPVLLPLTLPDGSYPVPTGDEVCYTRTFFDQEALTPLHLRTIVLHGLTVNGVYDPSLPVACGELKHAGNVKMRDCKVVKYMKKKCW